MALATVAWSSDRPSLYSVLTAIWAAADAFSGHRPRGGWQVDILLVAAHRPREFREARRIMAFMKQRSPVPMIIGLTHTDCPGAWDAANIALALGYPNPARCPPLVTVNANETASVAQAVIALVQHTWAGSLTPTT